MINAYICEIDPTLTNERPIDHAKKMVNYLPLIQERISTMPMQVTIYLEFCGKALAEEAGRLRSIGWHQGKFSSQSGTVLTLCHSRVFAGTVGGNHNVDNGQSGSNIQPSVSARHPSSVPSNTIY